jgi:hypothetical protein
MMIAQARLADGQLTTIGEVTIMEFKARFRGELVTPQSPHYDEIRLIWNGMHDKRR